MLSAFLCDCVHRLWENKQLTPQESTDIGLETECVSRVKKSIKNGSRIETHAQLLSKLESKCFPAICDVDPFFANCFI